MRVILCPLIIALYILGELTGILSDKPEKEDSKNDNTDSNEEASNEESHSEYIQCQRNPKCTKRSGHVGKCLVAKDSSSKRARSTPRNTKKRRIQHISDD